MVGDSTLHLKKGNKSKGSFFVVLNKHNYPEKETKINIGVYNDLEKIDNASTNFISK